MIRFCCLSLYIWGGIGRAAQAPVDLHHHSLLCTESITLFLLVPIYCYFCYLAFKLFFAYSLVQMKSRRYNFTIFLLSFLEILYITFTTLTVITVSFLKQICHSHDTGPLICCCASLCSWADHQRDGTPGRAAPADQPFFHPAHFLTSLWAKLLVRLPTQINVPGSNLSLVDLL